MAGPIKEILEWVWQKGYNANTTNKPRYKSEPTTERDVRRIKGLTAKVNELRRVNKHQQERIKYLEYKARSLQEASESLSNIYLRERDNRRSKSKLRIEPETSHRFAEGTLGYVLESFEEKKLRQNPQKDTDL